MSSPLAGGRQKGLGPLRTFDVIFYKGELRVSLPRSLAGGRTLRAAILGVNFYLIGAALFLLCYFVLCFQ